MSYGTAGVIRILMVRDGVSEAEARDLVEECREQVAAGDDPEEVLLNELGLEPDYLYALL